MRDELELKLAERFPFMRWAEDWQVRWENGKIPSVFGCEIGDGWYELMVDLCTEITAAYKRSGAPVDIVVDQVKEKWGGLRFYYHIPDHSGESSVFSITGMESLQDAGGESPLQVEISEIVRKYEEMSFAICEDCGKQGTRRKLGYVCTLCDECFAKRFTGR